MKQVFITEVQIEKVRHLQAIEIPLSKDEQKPLILTGKNGSGKTSVLDAVIRTLFARTMTKEEKIQAYIDGEQEGIKDFLLNNYLEKSSKKNSDELAMLKRVQRYYQMLTILSDSNGLRAKMNVEESELKDFYKKGLCIFAYYKADRFLQPEIPKHIEKVELKDQYKWTDHPNQEFIKYMIDLKMTQALALAGGNQKKAQRIQQWFDQFQSLLQMIFEDSSVVLKFDEETFRFFILQNGRETFDFNTLSSGYDAVLDIVTDLIMRMEKKANRSFQFDLPGVVLIDEIETHLHLELQKRILPILMTIFPNIQFIVSTHSPFILNSIENAVIFDLENKMLVEQGMANIPYEGIVEGYFKADKMSELLKEKYEKYKLLVHKQHLTDHDLAEISRLELYLEEIPDYLALDITTEYEKQKLYFEQREDL